MNDISAEIVTYLQTYKKKRIELDTLQSEFGRLDYSVFRDAVQTLLDDGELEPIQAAGVDFSGLPRRFRIVPGRLFSSVEAIQKDAIRYKLSPQLDLTFYYEHPLFLWQRDLPRIYELSNWLKRGKWRKVSNQQRSWDIFKNEKYLLEDGAKLIKRLRVTYNELGIIDEPDPLMLAINPEGLKSQVCQHLVVENKAPYQKILPHLRKTGLTSLILGYGWKIVGNLSLLPRQIGRPYSQHIVWYFGDFDWEGLHIWQSVKNNPDVEVRLALPFYRAYLKYDAPYGKSNQQEDTAVFDEFAAEIGAQSKTFAKILKMHRYYPQEALSQNDLLHCIEELMHGT